MSLSEQYQTRLAVLTQAVEIGFSESRDGKVRMTPSQLNAILNLDDSDLLTSAYMVYSHAHLDWKKAEKKFEISKNNT